MVLNTKGPLHSHWLNGNLVMYPQAMLGTEYCVDSNAGLDTNSGLDWDNAFKTLAVALAASDADIAKTNHWDRRNRIYVNGGPYTETLTKLAQKTDVIGIGSTNQHPRARIVGTHTIEAYTTATYLGCRFFNIEFYGSSAAAILTVPAHHNGLEFHNCVFSAVAAATIGLKVTEVHDLVIEGCRFDPNTSGVIFSTAAIQVASGVITNLIIKDNFIRGAIGIDINSTDCLNGRIDNNIIYSSGLCIDDESDDVVITNNRMFTAAACGATGATLSSGIDYNALLANGNFLTSADGALLVPPADMEYSPG